MSDPALETYRDGWKANDEYRRDNRRLNEAGSGWRALAMVALLYGSMSSLMLILMTTTNLYGPAVEWNEMRQPFSTYMLVIGLGLCAFSVWALLRSRKVYRDAKVVFDEKWNSDLDTPAPKTVDAMNDALDQPVTQEDLKLITMASIRLTSNYPDLADQLAILKVRIQKRLNA